MLIRDPLDSSRDSRCKALRVVTRCISVMAGVDVDQDSKSDLSSSDESSPSERMAEGNAGKRVSR